MTHGWTPRRIAILGASGLTGSGLALQLALADAYDEIVLFDLKMNVLESHAIDMREAQIVEGRTRTRLVVGSLDDVQGHDPVDLVVFAASLPETPEGSREAFLEGNLGVMRSLLPAITHLAGARGLVLVLTNPSDVLATCLALESEIAPARIFGYSLNDSVRFISAIARELEISPGRIDALVVGEHGDGQVPAWGSVRIDGDPVTVTAQQRERIDADARGWFRRWSQLRPGRSSGWTTPLGSARTVAHLAAGTPVPVAVWRDSAGAHATLRAEIRNGHVVPIPHDDLDDAEIAAVDEAFAAVAEKARRASTLPRPGA